jgi:hypothetical protein
MHNGTDERRSLFAEILHVFRGHVDLAGLEARYEAGQAMRRLLAFGAAALLGIAAFVYLQLAIVAGLVALGLKLVYASLILAAVYGAGAYVILRFLARRDPNAGQPFEGTRREMEDTLEWIQKLFS